MSARDDDKPGASAAPRRRKPVFEDQSFLSHLEELRRVLLRCAGAWALALPAAFWFARHFIKWMLAWCATENISTLHYFSLFEVFLMRLRVAAVAAVVLSFPYSAWKIWSFVLPALTVGEKRAFRFWVWFSSLLFAAGAVFCGAVALPMVVRFSASFATEQIVPTLGLEDFVSMMGTLPMAFGVAFQTPVAVCIAVRFGLVTVEALKKGRPYSIIIILIIAAVLTPPDVVSQILVAAPMLLLYELGLWLSSRGGAGRRAGSGGGDSADGGGGSALLDVASPSDVPAPAPPLLDFGKNNGAILGAASENADAASASAASASAAAPGHPAPARGLDAVKAPAQPPAPASFEDDPSYSIYDELKK